VPLAAPTSRAEHCSLATTFNNLSPGISGRSRYHRLHSKYGIDRVEIHNTVAPSRSTLIALCRPTGTSSGHLTLENIA
jgi:hypothetical protein